MNTAQLKNLVIDKICDINDEDFLMALKKILDMSVLSESVYKLSDEQREIIRVGKQQIADGEFIENEELEQEEDRWLNE